MFFFWFCYIGNIYDTISNVWHVTWHHIHNGALFIILAIWWKIVVTIFNVISSLSFVVIMPGASFSKKSGGADTKSAWLFSAIYSNSGINTDKDVWLFVNSFKKWGGSCPPSPIGTDATMSEWLSQNGWVSEWVSEWAMTDPGFLKRGVWQW